MSEKCIDACDELILWFGDGPYVERALELKMLYQPCLLYTSPQYVDENSSNPKMEEPASEDDYEIEELEPEERTEKE